MTVEQLISVLVSGGGGAALVVFLFWQNMQNEKSERFERERYISKLERENEQMRVALSETERPTRPVRMPAKRA